MLSLFGSLAVLVFLGMFGLKILVGFSLAVDKLRGSVVPAQNQAILRPPTRDPLPEATNSATVTVTGSGQAGLTLILYVNEAETKKVPVPDKGTFTLFDISVKDGTNTISAKLTDNKGNTSDLSNVISTVIKRTPPALDITAPGDGTRINGEKNTVLVNGKTDEDAGVTINDRVAVVRGDGSFSYEYSLPEGDTTLTIVATDAAGNKTTVQRRVTYQK